MPKSQFLLEENVRRGKQMRYYRERKGQTQKDLAQKVGMSDVAICHIEKGKCKPSVKHWHRIRQELDIPPDVINQTEYE